MFFKGAIITGYSGETFISFHEGCEICLARVKPRKRLFTACSLVLNLKAKWFFLSFYSKRDDFFLFSLPLIASGWTRKIS